MTISEYKAEEGARWHKLKGWAPEQNATFIYEAFGNDPKQIRPAKALRQIAFPIIHQS